MKPYTILIVLILTLVGCETVSETVDSWFTQGEQGQPSEAEQVTDGIGFLLPSPYRELVVGVVGAFAGFWTQKKRAERK